MMLLLAAYCEIAFSTQSTSFDVPGGSYEIVFDGHLSPGTLVKCSFDLESLKFGDGWLPSVAIFFESDEHVGADGVQVRLSALGSDHGQGWRHRLTVYDSAMNRKADINVHTGTVESVMQLNMLLTDRESIVFFVGNEAAEYSELDISPAVLTKWTVIAVGVAGTGQCETRLPEISSPP